MRLTVLSVAYKLATVGPDAVGGAEQVLAVLDAALVQAGHRSVVVAMAGSAVAGELVPFAAPPPGTPLDDAVIRSQRDRVQEALVRAVAEIRPDIVHMHGFDFHDLDVPPGPTMLVTLHLPPEWYPPRAFATARPDTWLHCVSQHAAARAGSGPLMLPPIGNGVPVDRLAAVRIRKRPYALMLARICPKRGCTWRCRRRARLASSC